MSNEKKSGIQPLDLDSLEEVAGGYSKHIIKPVQPKLPDDPAALPGVTPIVQPIKPIVPTETEAAPIPAIKPVQPGKMLVDI